MNQKKVLVCPIDWGLGHATRTYPVIQELLRMNCEVSVATNGPALSFLKNEFPSLRYFTLTGYEPLYSKSGSLIRTLAWQSPKFIRTIKAEHRETENIVRQEGIDVIISDNRFGCWSQLVPSVIITHQLNILAPWPIRGIINFNNRRLIRKFSSVWVPDKAGPDSLAGEMVTSGNQVVTRIGFLSRFSPLEKIEKKFKFLGLVSGPEPQRRILEDLLRSELKQSGLPSMLVCGRPGTQYRQSDGPYSEAGHLPSAELNQLVQESELVISRSGYSTIMDLAAVGGKAIFIPTPGQPEQVYLGKKLMSDCVALCVDQKEFKLLPAAEASKTYRGFPPSRPSDDLIKALNKLLQ